MIRVIDSHTGGEPTRVIIRGGPDLGSGSMVKQREIFQRDYDHFRSTVVNEPRGNDVLVGALLCKPQNPANTAGVIFFNNVGTLGMCGHGTIGLMVTLAYLGRIKPGVHVIETAVGDVEAELFDDHTVCVRNVPSYRTQKNLSLDVPSLGTITGDVAWGGNWFFLVSDHGLELSSKNVDELMEKCGLIRKALQKEKVIGDDGAEVDHVELFGPADDGQGDSKNFVYCPGKVYDRSPCGTGTSAKISCLAADGKLAENTTWLQASILNSIFECSYTWLEKTVVCSVKGSAYITAEVNLICQEGDPFYTGICDV